MATAALLEMLPAASPDQLVAMSCQLLSLLSAIGYYHLLPNKTTSLRTRQLLPGLLGVVISLVCYGWQSVHLFALCFITYLLMTALPSPYRGWIIFSFCVLHVLAVHLHQYLVHYMVFPIEVSNSLMIMAMKASYTAFSVEDGDKPEEQLTVNQKINRIKGQPSLFEYCCFCFCFLGFMFGPAYHLRDYRLFTAGVQYRTLWPSRKGFGLLGVSVICLACHLSLVSVYGPASNLEEWAVNSGVVTRHLLLWFTMFVSRLKYYFGWLSSEAICYLCGLGYDPDRRSPDDWGHGIATVRLSGIEFATSLKMFADSWNIFTARWLQFCLYERLKKYRVTAVFTLSAIWHGFYPGFYLMFLPLGFSIHLGRKLRRTLRPHFQQTALSRSLYDVITWAATTLLIAFNSSAFELKAWHLIYALQRSFYFWPHILVLAGIVLVPNRPRSVAEKSQANRRATGDRTALSGERTTPTSDMNGRLQG